MAQNVSIEKKRKQLTSSSTGNQYKFNQQLPKKSKEISSELIAREHFQDIRIINDLDNLSHYCASGGDFGCCLKHFIDEKNNLPDEQCSMSRITELLLKIALLMKLETP
jgi:hypothetical protein